MKLLYCIHSTSMKDKGLMIMSEMEFKYYKKQLHWLWLSWFILVFDQFSKWFALRHLSYDSPVVINSLSNFTLEFNTGAAFSFLHNQSGWQNILFSVIAIVMCTIILIMLVRLPLYKKLIAASLSLILGGAAGNLFDRLMHAYVIDFISLHVNGWYWPTFNIADAAICIGAFLFAIGLHRDKK